MSNLREVLFMENKEWVKTKALEDDYRKKIREYFIAKDDSNRRAYCKLLDQVIERKKQIESDILAAYYPNQKVYQLVDSDTISDNYITDQIAKNGYLTGSKF